jgi:multidrug efflux pump subunit AcrB
MVDTFIRRPILASVCSLVLILAGAVAIPTMPVAQYPALAPPQITVTAFYTGANAQEVETSVTTPLEQAINGVEGMSYMTSSSTNSGVSTINVTFDITGSTRRSAGCRRKCVRQGSRSRSSRPASSWRSACTPRRGSTTRCS